MIIEEKLNERLIRRYSDKGARLIQVETGLVYDEAIDLIPCQYSYEETDERIAIEEDEG